MPDFHAIRLARTGIRALDGGRKDCLATGPVRIVLSRTLIVRVLLAVVCVLVLLSLAGQVARFYLGYETALGLVAFFYVDEENNLPTWYQSMALLASAVLLAVIAVAQRRARAPFARHWAALGVIFVCLSIDEVGSFHEMTTDPLQRVVGVPLGAFAPTWVILALPAVAAFGLAYLRFLFHLAWRERIQVVAAAVLLVGGALGMEMLNAGTGLVAGEARKATFAFGLWVHLEEAMEMLGVVVFLDFLLTRLGRLGTVSVRVA